VSGGTVMVDPGSSIDVRIRAIAGAQRNQVSWRQLQAVGVAGQALTTRVRNGRLIRVHPGVYAIAPVVDVPLAPETAAILACGDRAVLAFHSAITVWRMRHGIAVPIHVLVPRDRRGPKLDAVRIHRTNSLTHTDVTVYRELPITTPARAALDVAATLPPKDLRRVVAEGFALDLLGFDSLYAALARAPKHPGACTLKEVLAKGELHRTTTDPEEQLLQLIRAARLPEPETQYPLLEYTADFYWPEYKLIVETDGGGWHKTPWRRKQDKRRDARVKHELGIDNDPRQRRQHRARRARRRRDARRSNQ
jgi:very-short-patch-repair endonuclease